MASSPAWGAFAKALFGDPMPASLSLRERRSIRASLYSLEAYAIFQKKPVGVKLAQGEVSIEALREMMARRVADDPRAASALATIPKALHATKLRALVQHAVRVLRTVGGAPGSPSDE